MGAAGQGGRDMGGEAEMVTDCCQIQSLLPSHRALHGPPRLFTPSVGIEPKRSTGATRALQMVREQIFPDSKEAPAAVLALLDAMTSISTHLFPGPGA